ncbi:MAG: hypothetical protein DLM50_00285 [Candidatus Meridianibacter frigidus]|nr:MAG: hypothetical protein DLM50_00285 [Candidatus Eremiobacteraeota bacterium]
MKGEPAVIASLFVAILGGIVFAVAYAVRAPIGAQGFGVFLAAAGLCAAFGIWGLALLAPEERVEQRKSFAQGRHLELPVLGRPLLVRLLASAIGLLGIAALFPIRSLGPAPGDTLFKTKWRRGLRVVREDGRPIKRGDLNVDSIITAFPDGSVGDAASQIVLVRLPPGTQMLAPGKSEWAPEGYAGFSKVCTHAGCPVALYRAAEHQLMCPCHQSLFDVTSGAQVISGPADRALPQLPLHFDDDR